MTRLEQLLSQYAAYHLDQKNVLTHFIGIPMIVFSIMCLTARAGVMLSGFEITLALVLLILSVIYYLRLDKSLGFLMLLIYAIAYPFAYKIAQLNMSTWLVISIGSFVVGWVFQFIGHFYEKKKPAFVDDLVGLAIGPLFVLAEFVFLLGFRKDLQTKMLAEARKQRSVMDQKSLQTLHAK
ncbi:Mpo1 family 2-hydroxy fatty acid dioxygenase [Acinetobacter bereziniae]|uniref:Mpo1 family 2-hydroxy fatty acid dioxygenase n=1 Tax=Acinetobacter bereziniae TaxID=106648 RepID=UPI00124D38BA|nr:Mpo1-like protein [Acinetobacter bereziniae]MDR6540271.1 putative membrane protein YGL010W [Acinetobacter bereziniae]